MMLLKCAKHLACSPSCSAIQSQLGMRTYGRVQYATMSAVRLSTGSLVRYFVVAATLGTPAEISGEHLIIPGAWRMRWPQPVAGTFGHSCSWRLMARACMCGHVSLHLMRKRLSATSWMHIMLYLVLPLNIRLTSLLRTSLPASTPWTCTAQPYTISGMKLWKSATMPIWQRIAVWKPCWASIRTNARQSCITSLQASFQGPGLLP